MRKPFIIGVVVGIVLVMAASIAVTLPFSAPFDKACRDISVFDDISELSFLKPYETEKVDRLLPDGAKESYCANISYKGGSYTVTAFVFDSEDLAWRYMFDVSDESFPTTGTEYRTEYDMAYIESLLGALYRAGMKTVILTGVSFEPSTTGVIVAENGKTEYYRHRRLPQGCHGTGDVFASAFCGALLRGRSKYDSAAIAADFTLKCIENTVGDESHRYGVKFETAIPDLIASLGK